MYFGLSEEQTLLRDAVARFLEDKASLDAVRAHLAGDYDLSVSLGDGLAELGVTQLVIPEADGGAGLGLLEAALVQQTLGQFVAPAAFLARSVLAGLLIRDIEAPETRTQFMSDLHAGTQYAVALTEAVAHREGGSVTLDKGCLTGRLNFVLEAQNAEFILVPIHDQLTPGDHYEWACVPCAEGRVETLKTIDRTRQFHIYHFEAAPCVTFKASVGAAQLIMAARILLAADSFGAAEAMIEKAVAYALQREQFGRVIGSFQAVKHLCAEMAAQLEPLRSLLWYAAYAYDKVPEEAPLISRLLKARMSEIGRDIARGTTEVHGGMGFTDLLGLHFWFKRIGVNRQLLGGPEHVRAEAAQLQGWGR